MTNPTEKNVRDSGELNQKTVLSGRTSDKVDQEGKNGDFSTSVNQSYKKKGHTKKSNNT